MAGGVTCRMQVAALPAALVCMLLQSALLTTASGLADNVRFSTCQYVFVITPAVLLAWPTKLNGAPVTTVKASGTEIAMGLADVPPDPPLPELPPPQAAIARLDTRIKADLIC